MFQTESVDDIVPVDDIVQGAGVRPWPALLVAFAALAACVEVKDPAADETPLPVLALELGERVLLELDQPLETGESVVWRLGTDAFGVLEQDGDVATFTAAGTTVLLQDEFKVFADVSGGAASRTESDQIIISAPSYAAPARPYQFAGGDDYVITGSAVDLVGDTLLMGHSAYRSIDGEQIGKFAHLSRYTQGNSGTSYVARGLPALSEVLAVALERAPATESGGPSAPDAFALLRPYTAGQGLGPARLERYDDSFTEVWSVAETGFTFSPAIATTPEALYVAVGFVLAQQGGLLQVRRYGLDGTYSGTASPALQADEVRGIAASSERVYVLTATGAATRIQAFDRDLAPIPAEDFSADDLPLALQDLAGPDDKGRLLACGMDTWHMINARGLVVWSPPSTVLGSGDGLTDVAVDGGRVRLYDRRLGSMDGETFVAELVELEAQTPVRPVRLAPSGTILNVGRSRAFRVIDVTGAVREDFAPLPTPAGRVEDLGSGVYRLTAGGLLGTYPLVMERQATGERVTAYVNVNAFNFGFSAPVPGPGVPSHDARVAMAAGGDYLVFAYSNPDTDENYVHRLRFDEEFCGPPTCTQMPGERLVNAFTWIPNPFVDEDVTANVAASPSGVAYWIDKLVVDVGGFPEERLQLKRWRPAEGAAASFPMGANPGTPGFQGYLRNEFRVHPDPNGPQFVPGWITAGPAVPGSAPGTEASLYWVRWPDLNLDEFVLLRYDVPAGLASGSETDASTVEVFRAPFAATPTDLALASDGTLITHTSTGNFLGRVTPPATPGGAYVHDAAWKDMGSRVVSVEVGAGDLIYVNLVDPAAPAFTKIVVLDRDGTPVEGGEVRDYTPDRSSDYGQTRLEEVRDMAVDRAQGRLRLFDKIDTSASPQGDVAILGVELDPR